MGKRKYKFQQELRLRIATSQLTPGQRRRPPPQRQPPPPRPTSPLTLQKDLPSDVNAMWLKMDITSLLKSKTVCKSWEGLISNGLSSNEYLSLSLSLSIKNIPESDDDLSWLLELGTIKNVEWIEIDYHKLNDPVTLLEIDETESVYKEDEAENANDGDEAEAEARVLRICRFDLGNQTFEQMECLGVNPRPDDGERVLGVWNNHLALCFSTPSRDDAAHHEEFSVWIRSEVDGIWSLAIRVRAGRQVSIELLANGDHVTIGSRANFVRDAIMVYFINKSNCCIERIRKTSYYYFINKSKDFSNGHLNE
ncbi:hypothetical protein Tco_1314497 [Tanacetum coccineum]